MVCPTILAPAVLVSTLLLSCYAARHDGEAILLENVKVLTLRHGEMTNGRRSSSVPQLKCIGGTAGCEAFRPQVVQCYNRGSDGYDIQWECKTDMDNAYRFGKVQVSCEGYNSPDDPYILKGSCGLEYSLDLTAEGHQQRTHQGDHQYYAKPPHHHEYQHSTGYGKKATSILGDLMYLAIVAAFIYFIYKKCIATPIISDDPPPYDETFRQDAPHGNQPPPYGFRQDYMPNTGDGSCSGGTGTSQSTHTNTAPGTGGGFWSGAMTGGLFGYLFGNRNNYNNYGYTQQHRRPGWGWGTGGGWGTGTGWGTGWGSGWGSNSSTRSTYSSSTPSAPRSSGTRTASGFGGTTRR